MYPSDKQMSACDFHTDKAGQRTFTSIQNRCIGKNNGVRVEKNNVHAGMVLMPLHERHCLRVCNIRMRRFMSGVTARNLMFTYCKITFALKVTCSLTTRPYHDECMRYKNTHIRGL